MLLKQKTNKLFYGRWPYKLTCHVMGIHYLREELKIKNFDFYGEKMSNKFKWIISGRIYGDKVSINNILEFLTLAKPYIENLDIKKRVVSHTIDLYFLDIETFTQAQNILYKFISSITEPENINDLNKILEDKKFILCDKLPYKKYKYKVYFKSMPDQVRYNLISWAKKYGDTIFIPHGMRKNNPRKYVSLDYFYVKDDKLITFISLAASGYVRRTDEYVLRTSINTEHDREILCQL